MEYEQATFDPESLIGSLHRRLLLVAFQRPKGWLDMLASKANCTVTIITTEQY